MSRAILGLVGLGFLAWAVVAFLMNDMVSASMGLQLVDGDGYIEFIAVNTGFVAAVGVFAILGAVLDRLRVSAILMLIVLGAGFAGGRIIGLASGFDPGPYTYAALAFEIALVALSSFAYVYEKREVAQQRAPEPPAPTSEKKRDRKPTAPSTPTAMHSD